MDGIIIVDKPKGITSFKVIEFIRRLTRVRRVGHAGTLDPWATGVLIVCVGKTCGLVSKLVACDKEYLARITFGISTDTGDPQGKIIGKEPVNIKKEDLEKALKSFVGESMQIPPMVSAVRHKGKHLYDLARKGITVEREPRKIKIHSLELLSFNDGEFPSAEIKVSCSKGTYIRTLCEDIGKKLGCFAHESELKRTKVGNVDISQSLTFDALEQLASVGKLSEAFLNGIKV